MHVTLSPARVMSAATYERDYAAHFCEWAEGFLYAPMPVHAEHDALTRLLMLWLSAYLELHPVGELRSAPFMVRLGGLDGPRREPDLMLILQAHLGRLTPTYLDGPPDVAIEVLSPESAERDRAEKFAEYARYGVGEYWLIDPTAQEADFFSLQDGLFQPRPPDAKGIYTSPLVPSLRLPLALLWTRPPLGPARVVAWVAELCPSEA